MSCIAASFFFFFFNDTATTEIYTLSLHDALPISTADEMNPSRPLAVLGVLGIAACTRLPPRSEEHTSELQSQSNLVCRLLLEKKKHQAGRAPPERLAGLFRRALRAARAAGVAAAH